jgi:hypothetical protein
MRGEPETPLAKEGGTDMYDSFSEGGVFWGRAMLLVAAAVALSVLLQAI